MVLNILKEVQYRTSGAAIHNHRMLARHRNFRHSHYLRSYPNLDLHQDLRNSV